MGLEELQPVNTLRTKATAVAPFSKFLRGGEVEEEYVRKCIEEDESGKSFVYVIDKFGMYLEFGEGKKGKLLARNTAMQYYRQAKIWLLDQFPQHQASLESRLLKMGKTLNKFCLKRDGGGFISKAPPCTKADLKKMLVYLYTNACFGSDYQDAALLCLLWYLFGRASDLSMIWKRNIFIDAADVFFLRLVRMKTSEGQGLSLFPDAEFASCPLLAVALALIVQAVPSSALIDNLPDQAQQTAVTLSPDVPLVELRNARPEATGLVAPAAAPRVDTAPTINAHVNRVLDRVAHAAGVAVALTSHSFRRGGAQHANGCAEMTVRWIFDRGAWNLTTTNKGFNYIFNTSKQDHMIAKVLSGYKPKAAVPLQDLSRFDSQTLESIDEVQRNLFAACYQLETEIYNVNKKVLDVRTACVVRHYPLLKNLSPQSPAMKRIEIYVTHAGHSLTDLLAWPTHLTEAPVSCKDSAQDDKPHIHHDPKPRETSYEQKVIDHQAAVITHFMENSNRQEARMDRLEAKMNGNPVPPTRKRAKGDEDADNVSKPKKKQRRGSAADLHATWFT